MAHVTVGDIRLATAVATAVSFAEGAAAESDPVPADGMAEIEDAIADLRAAYATGEYRSLSPRDIRLRAVRIAARALNFAVTFGAYHGSPAHE